MHVILYKHCQNRSVWSSTLWRHFLLDYSSLSYLLYALAALYIIGLRESVYLSHLCVPFYLFSSHSYASWYDTRMRQRGFWCACWKGKWEAGFIFSRWLFLLRKLAQLITLPYRISYLLLLDATRSVSGKGWLVYYIYIRWFSVVVGGGIMFRLKT